MVKEDTLLLDSDVDEINEYSSVTDCQISNTYSIVWYILIIQEPITGNFLIYLFLIHYIDQ